MLPYRVQLGVCAAVTAPLVHVGLARGPHGVPKGATDTGQRWPSFLTELEPDYFIYFGSTPDWYSVLGRATTENPGICVASIDFSGNSSSILVI